MKQFKQYLTERRDQVELIRAMIKAGRFQNETDLLIYLDSKFYVRQMPKSGFYSILFGSKNRDIEYVLKVSKPMRGAIDAWPKFAKKIQGGSNPLYPKIIFVEQLPNSGFVGAIEALDIDEDKVNDWAKRAISLLPEELQLRIRSSYSVWDALSSSMAARVERVIHHNDSSGQSKVQLEQIVKALAETSSASYDDLMSFLFIFGDPKVGGWDLHDGNVGFRKTDGHPVFFDPIQ